MATTIWPAGFYFQRVVMRKVLSIVLTLTLSLFIISGAIAVPILFRSLYYLQIESLNLVEETGLSRETIKEAYDEMMDYCIHGGPGSGYEFGTGQLKWSQWGKTHFDDVAKLFLLDIRILEISAAILLVFIIAKVISKKELTGRFLDHGPLFWGPVVLLSAFVLVGAFALIDFDSFFVKFHQLFFPGKDNWIFDPNVDEIIRILPENLFRNFAILIVLLILIMCTLSITIDLKIGRKSKSKQ